jgi:hypothetical protein
MVKSPRLEPGPHTRADCRGSVVFAVYAPIGTDPLLSRHPLAQQPPIEKHPMTQALRAVAACGVHVSALIDLYEDDTWLLEIPAGVRRKESILSTWKQDMSAPQALAGFLRRTHARFPQSTPVLAIEGHGGAFVPDIDFNRLTPSSATRVESTTPPTEVHWISNGGGATFGSGSDPSLPMNSPILPMNSPILPMNSPILPAGHLPMSTWALGEALRLAVDEYRVPRPALIHFNNCFNASFELLHTVEPWTSFATGYANYDFYTAGAAYPAVFQWLQSQGSATTEDLARRFAEANRDTIHGVPDQPSIGSTVALRRMKRIAAAIDLVASKLVDDLRAPLVADRDKARGAVRAAAVASQHYDTAPGFALGVPDQFMDLASFALALEASYPGHAVRAEAATLAKALDGLWVYGDKDRPYIDPNVEWNFSDQRLGLNIFFPDPDLRGHWDWRSPYYLSGRVDAKKPPPHRHIVPFLTDRAGKRPPWVEFIIAYHETTRFEAFLAPKPFFFPLSGGARGYEPPPAPPDPPQRPGVNDDPGEGQTPGGAPPGRAAS